MGRTKGSWLKLSPEVRREVIRLAAKGLSRREIIAKVSLSAMSVSRVLAPLGGVTRCDVGQRRGVSLRLEERIEIFLGLERGESLRAIGARLGRAPSTICREVRRGGGVGAYRPVEAERRATVAALRPKQSKLAGNPVLCARVITDLERLFSPQQIAATLRAEFGDDTSMTISHETIYKTLYLQGRGELRRELACCLRTGRAVRASRGRADTRGKIPDMVMISERPAEAADRAVPGHWEGDLILGKNGASAVGTLVERSTRFVMLLHLPGDHTADTVRAALTAKIAQLPAHLARSLTWDQGREMAGHARFSVDTGVPVYFCEPHSPWQRGSNENTNGLLRQYLPKGTDLSVHDPDHLDAIAISLNTRPRQTLNWMTPSKKLDELLVAATG